MSRFIGWLLRLPLVQSTLPLKRVQVSYAVDIPLGALHRFRHACALPLTTLLLDTELLISSPTHSHEVVTRLQLAATRLKDLFNETLEKNTSTFTAQELIGEIQQFFPDTVSILNKQRVAHLEIKGSKTLFLEVVICLVTNALEAYLPEEKPHVVVHFSEKTGVFEIKISDMGQGMNTWELVLAQVDGVSLKKQGSGVGLPFCISAIKKQFGGTIHVFSKKYMGTCVKVMIPTVSLLS